MTLETDEIPTSEGAGPPSQPGAKSQRAEFRKFCAVSAFFLAGFLGASLALNGIIGAYLHRTDHRGGLGGEVQIALERADRKSDAVRIIFLGDSVSHQLFKPNTEPGPQPGLSPVRFLTSNQAITVAGQCYLAENAFKQCPHITDVYLFYLPMAWRNDMPRDFTHDYFCGHFHSTAQVIEVFEVKRDIELSFAHTGRWLWPHLMAANSLSRPVFSMQPDARESDNTPGEPVPEPPDPERLLTQLSSLMAPPAPSIPNVKRGQVPVVLSPVSRYYLNKLRKDCADRGVRLHVLPCPVSDEKNGVEYVDPDHIYDGPIIGDVPANQLIDAVHFRGKFVQGAQERMIRVYGLDFLK